MFWNVSQKGHKILPNGKCSCCNEQTAHVEDGKLFIKTTIERINPVTGETEYKCRHCKQWLKAPFLKVVFDSSVKACSAI